VAIDPRNGAIRAMTAVTPNRRKNQYNLISQMTRQPGSTFKTIVLAAAIAEGMDPDTTSYLSAPFYYKPVPDGDCDDGSWWCVSTYSHSYLGYTSVTRATLSSDNTVYAQLTLDVGPEKVAAMARRLGVKTDLRVNGLYLPSMGLGAIEVSPLDLASAYATLAAGGIRSEPMAIRKVVLANGKTDESAGWGVPKRTRAIADWVAAEVTKVLELNMTSGTGTTAYFGRRAAGKTGTTEEHSDAWFAGYTPTLQATVWVGYTRGKIPMTNVHGISVSGSTFPSLIWRDFMTAAVGNAPERDFPEPKTEPKFAPFTKGTYGRSFGYDPGYSYSWSSPSSSSSDDEEEDEDETEERAATPEAPGAPASPAKPKREPKPAPASPPATTEAPPPPQPAPSPPEAPPPASPPAEPVPPVSDSP
jgi:penicillin-binding protein 1A